MKLIRVNMTDQSVRVEAIPAEYQMLGGRGLTSLLIDNEVPATCDALGPENKLIFAPGYLTGTPLINTSRLSVGAKARSPAASRRATWAGPPPMPWQGSALRP